MRDVIDQVCFLMESLFRPWGERATLGLSDRIVAPTFFLQSPDGRQPDNLLIVWGLLLTRTCCFRPWDELATLGLLDRIVALHFFSSRPMGVNPIIC
jgi:hypothetical protein